MIVFPFFHRLEKHFERKIFLLLSIQNEKWILKANSKSKKYQVMKIQKGLDY